MATSKTLNPTNVSISIPALGDVPDASVFSNCIDKEADAINALNSQIPNVGNYTSAFATPGNDVTFAPPKDAGIIVFKMPTTATTANTAFGYYVKQNGYLLFTMVTNHSSITVTTSGGNMTLATTNSNGAQAVCIGTAIS